MSTDDSSRRGGGFRRDNERPGSGSRGGFPRGGSGGGSFHRDNERPGSGGPRGGSGGFRRDNERPSSGGPRHGGQESGQQGWRPFQSPRPPRSGFDAREPRNDRPFAGRDDRGQQDEGWRGRERPSFENDSPEGGRPERPPFEPRGQEGGRPERPPFESRERRPFSEQRERPSFERGDRPPFGDRDRRPPFENRERRPYGERPGSDRPSFGGSRPEGGRQFEGESEPRDRRPEADRPAFNSRWRDGERPPFGGNRPAGDRPSFGGSRPTGDRPPYADRDRPSFGGPRPGGDRPAYGGSRPGYQGGRPFEGRPERAPFEGQGRPLGTSTRMGRPPVNQFEPVKADVYGRWPVLESLRAGNVVKVYLAAGVNDSADHLREIQTVAAEKHIPVVRVDRFALDKVLGNANHQGIAATCRPYQYVDLENVLEGAKREVGQPLVLLFDGIQDPQNLGSILRTAEAVGVGGAILPRHNQVGVTPSVVRASAGAAEHLPIAEVTNLRQTVTRLKESGYWIVGLDMEGGTDYDNFEVDNPIALVIGGEGKGLSRLVTEECDYLVRLPMSGKIGSLNASVAAGVVLYEIGRRRGGTRNTPLARPKERTAPVEPEPEAPSPVAEAPEVADLALELQAMEEDEAVFVAEDLSAEQREHPAEAGVADFEDEDEEAAKDVEPEAE